MKIRCVEEFFLKQPNKNTNLLQLTSEAEDQFEK